MILQMQKSSIWSGANRIQLVMGDNNLETNLYFPEDSKILMTSRVFFCFINKYLSRLEKKHFVKTEHDVAFSKPHI